MRRATKFILLLPFPVIVLIGVVVLSRLGPPPEQIRLVAQSELSRALGRPISIGRVERGTLAGAVLHDVRIGPAPHAQGEALLRTPQITVRYRLGDVLAGQTDAVGSIAQITLDRPTIAVERSAAGAWSVADLFARPKAAKPSKFAGRVVIRDGRLTLVDRHARLATTYEVKGLYADVDWGQPHWIQIAVSGESANSRFERLGAVFAYDRTKRAFQGTFEATGVTAATVGRYLPFFVPVRLASGKADVKALAFLPLRGKAAWSARLALDGVRVAAFGRSATVSGPAQLAGGVLRADGLSITMPEARLRVSGTAAGFPDTQLNLDVEARSGRPERLVPASARAALGKAVALKGPATARLRVVGPALAPSVAGRVALAGLTARGLRVEKPAADLTYREGQIWLDNFRADLAGGRVTGKAWVAPGKQGLDAVVRAEVAGVRAEQVARAMGQEPVRGGVSGDLAVSIARGKPEGVGRLGARRGIRPRPRARPLARRPPGPERGGR